MQKPWNDYLKDVYKQDELFDFFINILVTNKRTIMKVLIYVSLMFSVISGAKVLREIKAVVNQETFFEMQKEMKDHLKGPRERMVYFADSSEDALRSNKKLLRFRVGEKKKETIVQMTGKRRGLTPWEFKEFQGLEFSKDFEYKCEEDQVVGGDVLLSCSLSKEVIVDEFNPEFAFVYLDFEILSFLEIYSTANLFLSSPAMSVKDKFLGPDESIVYSFETWAMGDQKIFEVSMKGHKKKDLKKGRNFLKDYLNDLIPMTKTGFYYENK